MTIKKLARGQVVSGSLTGSTLDWSKSGLKAALGNLVGLHIEGDAVISEADWREFVSNIDELLEDAKDEK
jgi:hypothetical protein